MSYIKQHYHRLETDELLKLRASELTDEARVILESDERVGMRRATDLRRSHRALASKRVTL